MKPRANNPRPPFPGSCPGAGADNSRLHQELSARRQSEADLEYLLMLLGATLESTTDGILVLNRAGRVARFNQRLVELFAIPDDITAFWEHERLMAWLLSRFSDAEHIGRRLAGLFAAPEEEFFEAFEYRGDGVLECYSAPQPAGVDSIGRVISFRDVTERIRAQQALLREKAEQEALIRQLRDTRRQLIQSEQQASIGRLAAGLAHEINNPIGFVNSNLGRLQEYMDDLLELISVYEAEPHAADTPAAGRIAATRQRLDIEFLRDDLPGLLAESRDGVRRVQKIVQDLKDFSHAGESGWQYVDLHRGLDSTLGILRSEFREVGEVVREYGELPEVECLPSQLNQAFMNLLLNAAQAMAGRSGAITVRTGVSGGDVRVEIADQGEGIPPGSLEHIFEPFFTTRPAGQGSGLGLPVAASIVQRHGGRIEVESAPGRGSVFRIVLPPRQARDGEA